MKLGNRLLTLTFLAAGASFQTNAKEVPVALKSARTPRPNILWLTFEDSSYYEFGCYGNKNVNTPIIDSLAKRGILFKNAWATAPQSSPARSSLITGCYATTYGMDLHPCEFDTPDDIFFPQILRDNGYYCTNNNKTHYNTTVDNKKCWDECDRTASYNSPKRGKDQPFFAVFNAVTSHMGRVRTFHMDGRRDYSREGLYKELFSIPSHLPDLPEIRSDYAAHLEGVQDIDKWVGIFLKDLKDKGLDKNTIVFVFSDHGGCLPRGKGLPFETGLRVPMIVYVPEAYSHLCKFVSGEQNNELVNFTDLAPTVLSLAGIKPPKTMQGSALMGKYAVEKAPEITFAFGSNQLHHFMPMRVARTAKYKYFRSYLPYRQFALRNYYQWGMPANRALDGLYLSGKGEAPIFSQTYGIHPAEMLFDIENDPFETDNLAENPEYGKILEMFRSAMSSHIRTTGDLGFLLPTSRQGVNVYNMHKDKELPMSEIWNLVEMASLPKTEYEQLFVRYLSSFSNELRFYSVAGLLNLHLQGKLTEVPEQLSVMMTDKDPYVSAKACLALAYMTHSPEAVHRLAVSGDNNTRKIYFSALESLSLNKEMRGLIAAEEEALTKAAETLPMKENEDAGLMARGILVNIGKMPVRDMYGVYDLSKGGVYLQGIKLNTGRRKIAPLP